MKFDCIGFDLDGTLWDFTENARRSWWEVLEKQPDVHTYLTTEMIHTCCGMTEEDFLPRLLPDITDPARRDALHRLCIENEARFMLQWGGNLFPGTEEMLSTLSKTHPLFIASNCVRSYLDAFLTYYGFRKYFADVICYSDAHLPKGESIRLLMKRNGFTKALYVGDAQVDYEAAQAAGATFVHAAYGFGSVPEAKYAIENRMALVPLIRSLESA